MADRLYAKPGSERIKVTIGDMATTRLAARFRLVYLVFNTIGNLTTQDEQVACFANAAAHLEPGGAFLVEVGVPDLRRVPPGEDARVFAHAPGYVGYDHYVDFVAQQAVSHHFVADSTATIETTTPFRYVWPSELDLMAKLAGMTLRYRWAGWDRSRFHRRQHSARVGLGEASHPVGCQRKLSRAESGASYRPLAQNAPPYEGSPRPRRQVGPQIVGSSWPGQRGDFVAIRVVALSRWGET